VPRARPRLRGQQQAEPAQRARREHGDVPAGARAVEDPVLRSGFPPAPTGSSWPMSPTGRGSSAAAFAAHSPSTTSSQP
jgi:hypothetical protein